MFSIVDFAFLVQKKAVRGKVAGLFALMQEWVQRLTSLLNHKKLLFRGLLSTLIQGLPSLWRTHARGYSQLVSGKHWCDDSLLDFVTTLLMQPPIL